MAHPVDRALALWAEPLPEGDAALELFRGVYADPLPVNGVPTEVAALVARARMMQGALADVRFEILERTDTGDRSAFAFRIVGHHVGPLATPAGDIPATGQVLTIAAMDIMVVADDRVQAVWAISDMFTPLVQAGAIGAR